MPRCSYPKWGLGSPGSAGRTAAGSPSGSRGGPPARGNLGAGTDDVGGTTDPRVAVGTGSREGRIGSRKRARGGWREGPELGSMDG